MPPTEFRPFRVSELDTFRHWEEDEDTDAAWLVDRLTTFTPSIEMQKGTAFHAALEKACEGELDRIDSMGFTFLFDGTFEIALPKIREVRSSKIYNGLQVTGQVDGICGKLVIDHKTSSYFDAEKYFHGYQWRYYLDIFNADCFKWFIWEMREDACDPQIYTVHSLHVLEQFRYPEMERDCAELAGRFKAFVAQYMPETRLKNVQDKLFITDADVQTLR